MNTNEKELRELDAWIAEYVFGWAVKSRQCPHSSSVMEHFWYEPGNDIKPSLESSTQRMFPSGTIVGTKCPEGILHYSTAPAAAMEVLKKCLENSGVKIHKEDEGNYCCYVEDCFKGTFSEDAKTLELAICFFAKKLFKK